MQSPMIRSAYKQASYGLAEISVRAELRERFKSSKLDSWFIQSAVKFGIGQFKADKELGVDKRVFGGKKNLRRRNKGLITNEDWKELRLSPLYIIGEAPQKGNRKFDFLLDKIIFKPWSGEKHEIALPKLRKNYKKIYEQLVRLASEKIIPITVTLTSEFICLSYDEQKLVENKYKPPIKGRYAGIDLNPNYIGISVFDGDKLVATKLFNLKELTGKNTNQDKLNHETIEIGHSIGRWLKHLRVSNVFCEELSFSQGDSGIGKDFNRLTKNQWKREKLTASIEKYFKVIYINAAYSSTIGNLNHPNLPDPVAASAEIARRGFECVVNKSKKFYPDLISKRELEDRWKETEFPDFKNWKELHDFVKKIAKLRYRNPLPKEEFYRKFKSEKSSVYIVDNFLLN